MQSVCISSQLEGQQYDTRFPIYALPFRLRRHALRSKETPLAREVETLGRTDGGSWHNIRVRCFLFASAVLHGPST